MTKDNFEHLKPTQEGKTSEKTGNIAVDDMGIPILEEILTNKADLDADGKNKKPRPTLNETPNTNQSSPNNDIMLEELREQLKLHADKNIDEVAEKVAIKVVTSMTSELKQQIQAKLKEILRNNMDEMINKTISEIPKTK